MSSNNGAQPETAGQTSIPRPTAVNPETLARFRHESWWHIVFPVVATGLLGIVAVVLVALGGPEVASVVSSYALILIILLGLLFGLVGLVIIALLVYGVMKAIGFIPPYTYLAQQNMSGVHRWVDQTTNRIAGAVITTKSVLSGISIYMQQQGIISSEDGKEDGSPNTDEEAGKEPGKKIPVAES